MADWESQTQTLPHLENVCDVTTCLKTLPHLENGRDVTAYSMSGKVKNSWAGFSSRGNTRAFKKDAVTTQVYNEETRYMTSRPYFKWDQVYNVC